MDREVDKVREAYQDDPTVSNEEYGQMVEDADRADQARELKAEEPTTDKRSVMGRLFDGLGSQFESANLRGCDSDDPYVTAEWQDEDGRYWEAEFRCVGLCDMTAEVMAQNAHDREYEDDQAVGAYEMYGPDRPTWREMFPNE